MNAGLLSVRTGQPVDLGHSSAVGLDIQSEHWQQSSASLCFVVDSGPGNLGDGMAVGVLPAGCSEDLWAACRAAVSWALEGGRLAGCA